jgi:glycosyltransferase involved in cell wall biosynthesis
MDKVVIALATYNGSKYLEEQIESLFSQTYRNIDIVVRDDGSTDATADILAKYDGEFRDGISLHVLKDSLGNLGYVRNFLYIMRNCGDAAFYGFCDQDDFWLPDKVQRAVEALSKDEQDKPLIYASNYFTCDKDLNIVDKGHEPTSFTDLDVGKSLSLFDGGWFLGFTIMMNKALKQLAFDNDVEAMYSHDIWVQAVAVGFNAEFFYDSNETVLFRRHDATTSIAEADTFNSFLSSWKYRWQESFGDGTMFRRLKDSMTSYQKQYGDKVQNDQDVLFLELFGDEDASMHRINKLFYPHRLKKGIVTEMAWRFAILLGRI